jgi:hypothetical protein
MGNRASRPSVASRGQHQLQMQGEDGAGVEQSGVELLGMESMAEIPGLYNTSKRVYY